MYIMVILHFREYQRILFSFARKHKENKKRKYQETRQQEIKRIRMQIDMKLDNCLTNVTMSKSVLSNA